VIQPDLPLVGTEDDDLPGYIPRQLAMMLARELAMNIYPMPEIASRMGVDVEDIEGALSSKTFRAMIDAEHRLWSSSDASGERITQYARAGIERIMPGVVARGLAEDTPVSLKLEVLKQLRDLGEVGISAAKAKMQVSQMGAAASNGRIAIQINLTAVDGTTKPMTIAGTVVEPGPEIDGDEEDLLARE
jgi:hypothetical protein